MAHFEQLPVGLLRLDSRIYPRAQMDRFTIWRYSNSLRAGARLDEGHDPIRAWKHGGDYLLLDGAHRREAYAQLYGPEHRVRVLVHQEEEFADEAEALLMAVRLNSAHGRNLSPYDIALVYVRLQEYGVTVADLAEAALMPVETLQRTLERRLATGPLQADVDTGQQGLVALKRPAIHLAGDALSAEQASYQQKAVGLAQLRLIRELIRLIDTDTLHLEDAEVRAALRTLYQKVGALLATVDGRRARRRAS
jgi:hypothetical protein